MSNDLRIPIIEEEAYVGIREAVEERVSVRTAPREEQIIVRGDVRHENVDVSRVPVEREVQEAPPIRTEGDVTIVPILEERLVVEKRLFIVEELHIKRTTTIEHIELPTTVRRTHVEVEREDGPGEIVSDAPTSGRSA